MSTKRRRAKVSGGWIKSQGHALWNWGWSVQSNRGTVASCSQFVTRPGKLGIFLVKPYCAYAGAKTYERVSPLLTLRILLGWALAGWLELQFQAVRRIRRVAGLALWCLSSLKPSEFRRRRAAARQDEAFRKLWGS